MTIRVIPDSQAQLTALQNGEIAIASGQPTPDIANALNAGIKNVDYVGAPEASFEHVDLQVANGGPFDPATYGGDADKALKVREAFMKVLPRQEIVDKLIVPLQADAEVMNTLLFLPGSENGKKASEVSGYADLETPDIEGAKALLAEVGVTTPVKVRFMFSQTNTRRQQEYQLIKPYAAQAGFDLVDASSADWSTLVFTAPNTYDAALFAWIQNSTGVTQSAANYITGGANNPYGWSNSEVDGFFDKIDAEKDLATAEGYLLDTEKVMGTQFWSVPIFQFPGITAWDKSKVTGVTAMPLSPQYFWNFWEWTRSPRRPSDVELTKWGCRARPGTPRSWSRAPRAFSPVALGIERRDPRRMWSYVLRRLLIAVLVIFAASFLVYVLAANSGDPLENLRGSTAPNKEALIAAASARLHLEVPPPLRYFIWLGACSRSSSDSSTSACRSTASPSRRCSPTQCGRPSSS